MEALSGEIATSERETVEARKAEEAALTLLKDAAAAGMRRHDVIVSTPTTAPPRPRPSPRA